VIIYYKEVDVYKSLPSFSYSIQSPVFQSPSPIYMPSDEYSTHVCNNPFSRTEPRPSAVLKMPDKLLNPPQKQDSNVKYSTGRLFVVYLHSYMRVLIQRSKDLLPEMHDGLFARPIQSTSVTWSYILDKR
jgi:hypothetical protein